MIEREVNDIKANQNELKRINSILDENWTDSSAEQFKETYLGPIEAAGTAFIGESFNHAHELRSYLSDLEELKIQFERLKTELLDICQHPTWEGCGVGIVEGYTPISHYRSQEFFVITKEEMPYLNESEVMEQLAYRRVTVLEDMEDAHFYAPVY